MIGIIQAAFFGLTRLAMFGAGVWLFTQHGGQAEGVTLMTAATGLMINDKFVVDKKIKDACPDQAPVTK